MSNHYRGRRFLLLCEGKEVSRKRESRITVEVDELRYEETVEDGVQKKRVFDGLAQCLGLLDHHASLVERGPCLGCRYPFA
jgi:hypothetical protein